MIATHLLPLIHCRLTMFQLRSWNMPHAPDMANI
jgi:hypothetical protein